MKNLLQIFSLEMIVSNFKKISCRFPLPVAIVFLISGLFLSLVHGNPWSGFEEIILKVIFIGIITFFFSISLYMSTENMNLSAGKRHISQLFPLGFATVLFFIIWSNFDNFESILFLLLAFFGIFFYLFFAPYLKDILWKWVKQSVFYTYFYNISVVFLISTILGLILFTLGSIGISAVFALFDISIFNDKIYADWAILAFSFMTPLFALTKIPEKKSFKENYFNENAFFSFLIKYIAIPFIFVYFIILYAYSIKVLANFGDWPKGEVSWMVIGFSIFGYITYIFSYIFENTNKFIKSYRKYFPYAVIPQIFMLFYAIYLRIAQYDITVNRYLVVTFGIWLLCISLYFVFSRKKSLPVIPALLTAFTIIISVGPWSVHELPISRQTKLLTENLIEANILQDGKIVPLNNYNDIDKELSKNIASGIEYICDFNDCDTLSEIFPEQYSEIYNKWKEEFDKLKSEGTSYYKDKEYEGPSEWQVTDKIKEKIKVRRYSSNSESEDPTIYIRSNYKESFYPLDVSGYSNLIELRNVGYEDTEELYAKIDLKNWFVELVEKDFTLSKIDISEVISKIQKKYIAEGTSELDKKDLVYEIESNGKHYKIMFEYISIPNPNYKGTEEIKYMNADGFILIK